MCSVSFYIQTVNNLDVATYEANRAAYNVTFQQTIAATLDDITPEGITAIRVSARARRVTAHADAEVPQSTLQYTLTMFDAQVEFAVLREQLVQAVSAGAMDETFRHFAGMNGIDNSSYFGAPQASLAGGEDSYSNEMNGVVIACIVVGVMMAFGLCVVFAFFLSKQQQERSSAAPSEESQGAVTSV